MELYRNKNGFDEFFANLSGGLAPHGWQRNLSLQPECDDRLIRIPTGFGKTLGVLATWAWHRVHGRAEDWPRRLVWCLPMRVLVEQTETEVRSVLQRLDALWDGRANTHDGRVGVHLLMGGADSGQWHLYPEHDAVLIGTQDMLLSRAMNRGYASPRARWPMEFGLLNQDALWVMDEVQLMDVGLATSAQLQAFRLEDSNARKTLRPCFTWWMSATLQQGWLEQSPDTRTLIAKLREKNYRIEPQDRIGHLWDNVAKPMVVCNYGDSKALARDVSDRHREQGCGTDGATLVVVNTVKRALEVWRALRADKSLENASVDIRLVHSRFRPAERGHWRQDFLHREACEPGTNRIIVATQVIEAGVDISAGLLVTELAPWANLVQRFGRAARWGGTSRVVIADLEHETDRLAAPYSLDELEAAREACAMLQDVGPAHIERFEEANAPMVPRLYPYEPMHLLLRHELDELFDTSPDLSGADIDISRFIRSGDERDVQVFWMDVDDGNPPPDTKPAREELCSVPFLDAQDWLCQSKSQNLKPNVRAWVWDWLERAWRQANRRDIYPGQSLLVAGRVGGYDPKRGWDPTSTAPVDAVRIDEETHFECRPCWTRHDGAWRLTERRVRVLPSEDYADSAEEDESLSITGGWQTIASHGLEVGREVERIACRVAPALAQLLHLAGRWHDLGKAHPAFQGSMWADDRPDRNDLAKAPKKAWPCHPANLYRFMDGTEQRRRGFRHELASTLGLFAVLQRHNPRHQALFGPWSEWLGAIGYEHLEEHADEPKSPANSIEAEILGLTAEQFDLLAYLICAHHGKVRMAWHASPHDQEARGQFRIRGVCDGDELPSLPLAAVDGSFHELPKTTLDLSPSEVGLNPRTGRSWAERVLDLVAHYGPFSLALLETLLRAADQRASRQVAVDVLLQAQDSEHDS